MTWNEAFAELDLTIASREALIMAGATSRSLTSAVKGGYLLRVRRDHYALPGLTRPIAQAVRIGGRIACLSALAQYEIFAIDKSLTHMHLERGSSRLRDPGDPRRKLALRRAGVRTHWAELIDQPGGSEFSVGVKDAIAQVLNCQHRWHAVASVDNALHLEMLTERDVHEMFQHMPDHLQRLLPEIQLDGRSEAGQETVLRMVTREAGLHVEIQVTIDGVGRVDMIIEGCLGLEADSRQAHDGWELHVRDRNRDIEMARQGYMTLRPAYHRTMETPYEVLDAVLHLLAVNRHFRVIL